MTTRLARNHAVAFDNRVKNSLYASVVSLQSWCAPSVLGI